MNLYLLFSCYLRIDTLKEALESRKTIIVTTLQKFPVISQEIGELPGKRFALIVDEAHSSQSGESSKSLKSVLSSRSLEDAEDQEAGAETPEEELESAILAEMEKRGRLPNVSTFAFTAKPKTLELFGTKRDDGKFVPFHIYSMPGDRGRVYPRRPGELHHVQCLLAAAQEN